MTFTVFVPDLPGAAQSTASCQHCAWVPWKEEQCRAIRGAVQRRGGIVTHMLQRNWECPAPPFTGILVLKCPPPRCNPEPETGSDPASNRIDAAGKNPPTSCHLHPMPEPLGKGALSSAVTGIKGVHAGPSCQMLTNSCSARTGCDNVNNKGRVVCYTEKPARPPGVQPA